MGEISDGPALLREAARLRGAGRLAEAAATYQRLLARWPDQPDSWYNLALLQRCLRQYGAALESYAQALRRGVQRPQEVHLNRAVLYADCLRQEAPAERELQAALAIDPDYLPALHNLANLQEDLGHRAEALRLYRRILEREPQAFEALARYARLAEPDHELLERLRAALGDPAARAAQQASLGFALAHILEARGEYAAAFAAAQAANQASRASTGARYDRPGQERLIDEVIATFAGAPAAAADVTTAARPRPIFICGMFRSGSTLTERLLAGSGQVVAGGELDLLPHLVQAALSPFPAAAAGAPEATLARLAADYLAELAALFPQAAQVSDKWMENFFYIGLIRRLFPQARIVHTTRDPLDTCLSIYFLHLDQRLPWALELEDIGHYYRQYRRLMAHWRSLFGEQIFELNYESLVRDPRGSTQRLFGYCGLEWHESCLDFARGAAAVKTASVWQVREPLHSRACGRARRYERELAELAAYLSEPQLNEPQRP